MITAYPIYWPQDWPRTKRPQKSRFQCTFAAARDGIIKEIKLMGGKNPIISTNIELKQNGLPYAGQKQPDDRGVAVYFTYNGNQVVLACDKWDKIESNLHAIRKTIDAMRGVERWGVSDMLSRAFAGFKALPEKISVNDLFSCWAILEMEPYYYSDKTPILEAYKKAQKKYHPDNKETGNHERFILLEDAYKNAIKQSNSKP